MLSPGCRHPCSLHDTIIQLLLHIGTEAVAVAIATAAIQSLLHISAVVVAAAHCATLFFLIAAAASLFTSSSISPSFSMHYLCELWAWGRKWAVIGASESGCLGRN